MTSILRTQTQKELVEGRRHSMCQGVALMAQLSMNWAQRWFFHFQLSPKDFQVGKSFLKTLQTFPCESSQRTH